MITFATNSNSLFTASFLQKKINFCSQTLSNLIQVWQQALLSFLEQDFTKLDPLVCENLCHIRASALCDLANKYLKSYRKQYLYDVVEQINQLIQQALTTEINEKDYSDSIEDFLLKKNLCFPINEECLWDIKFIVLSYILTLTKKDMGMSSFTLTEKTCHEKILEMGLVHNKVKNYILSAQKELSAMSCEYIHSEALHLGNVALTKLLEIKSDNHGRSFVAQYPTGKTIVQRALQTQKIIILRVAQYVKNQYIDTVVLAFQNTNDGQALTRIRSLPFDTPCLVMSGVVNYEKHPESHDEYIHHISRHSLPELILANLAGHQQFSGSLREHPCIYKETLQKTKDTASEQNIMSEYEDYLEKKHFAETQGCGIENPSLLFLNHIYCDSTNTFIGDTLSPHTQNLYQEQSITTPMVQEQ